MYLQTEKELIAYGSSCKRDWNKEMWIIDQIFCIRYWASPSVSQRSCCQWWINKSRLITRLEESRSFQYYVHQVYNSTFKLSLANFQCMQSHWMLKLWKQTSRRGKESLLRTGANRLNFYFNLFTKLQALKAVQALKKWKLKQFESSVKHNLFLNMKLIEQIHCQKKKKKKKIKNKKQKNKTHTKTEKKNRKNKKHSENADTSTSVNFDRDVWPWPTSRSRNLMSLDVAYWIMPWFKVWCLWM